MRMPNLQTEIAKIATEIVGRHFRLWQDCWDFQECRGWQGWRDRRNCRPGLLALPILPADNGWLQAEIEKIDQVADRDCRDCRSFRPKITRLPELLAGWECQICRQRLPRLRRRMSADNAEIAKIAGIAKNAENCKIAEIAETVAEECRITVIVGREWVIAFWDLDLLESYLCCRTRLPGLPPKDAEICRVAESGKFSVRDWRRSWPRFLRLQRILPADIAETAEIAGNAEKADVSKIVEIAETVARDCRDYRFCRPTTGDCMLTLKTIDKISGRDCRNCRDCRRKTPRLAVLLRVPIF